MNKPPNPDNARSTRGGKATRVSASPRLDTPEVDANPWALLNSLEYGVVFLSPDERVVCCNAAFLRIWKMPTESSIAGVSLDELLATASSMLARPGEQSRFLMRAAPDANTEVKLDLPMADGRQITQQSHLVLHTDAQGVGQPWGRMWVYEDVTVARRNATQLTHLAERDALTGLYNRHRFNEEIVRMCADAQRNRSRLALLFLDLDGFKHINDTYGHRAGDATLIRIAKVVSSQVRRNEIFARLGGDEFAILAPDAPEDVLKLLASRITRSISQKLVEFEVESMQVTCSCGIALYPDNATTPDALIASADEAMYQAKEAGKNCWRFCRTASNDASRSSPQQPLSSEARVRHALDNHLLVPHYQGIYAARDRKLHHYEVFLRLRDDVNAGPLTLPGEFIGWAEKSGMIVDVDCWMLRHAIESLARDATIPALAVNVSGRSLIDDTVPAFIGSELKRNGVSPERLLVEVTETSVVSDLHDARRFISALQATGCTVSLDDFGTGFSSFTYLKHVNVDSIKIDGLFIRDFPNDPENQLFVQAIVMVARGLHKTTVAECVEDQATMEILASLGVDYVQGFHLQVPHTALS